MAASAQTNLAVSATNAVAEGLREIKGPMVIPTGWEWVWWALGALGAAVLLIGLVVTVILLLNRRRQLNLPPVLTAHAHALARLELALRLLGQPKPFIIEVSDTLRWYLEQRFSFRAPERTTEEFLHELQRTLQLLPNQKDSLGAFLQQCDLVKFARYEPGEEELRHLHASALQLVVETEPQPEPESGTGTLPAARPGEPAP